jgi:hypothetical protein
MPASPWRTFGAPDPNGEFVALLSYLPLKSYWRVLLFFLYTAQVVKQLASAEGLFGSRPTALHAMKTEPVHCVLGQSDVWCARSARKTKKISAKEL